MTREMKDCPVETARTRLGYRLYLHVVETYDNESNCKHSTAGKQTIVHIGTGKMRYKELFHYSLSSDVAWLKILCNVLYLYDIEVNFQMHQSGDSTNTYIMIQCARYSRSLLTEIRVVNNLKNTMAYFIV